MVLKLPGEQLKRLFAHSWLLEAETGEVLAERDSKEELLFLLAGGQVEAVLDTGSGRPTLLRTFATGDIFATAEAVARVLGGETIRQSVIYVPTKLVTSANVGDVK